MIRLNKMSDLEFTGNNICFWGDSYVEDWDLFHPIITGQTGCLFGLEIIET